MSAGSSTPLFSIEDEAPDYVAYESEEELEDIVVL